MIGYTRTQVEGVVYDSPQIYGPDRHAQLTECRPNFFTARMRAVLRV